MTPFTIIAILVVILAIGSGIFFHVRRKPRLIWIAQYKTGYFFVCLDSSEGADGYHARLYAEHALYPEVNEIIEQPTAFLLIPGNIYTIGRVREEYVLAPVTFGGKKFQAEALRSNAEVANVRRKAI